MSSRPRAALVAPLAAAAAAAVAAGRARASAGSGAGVSGRTAVVTGGGSGIGRSLCLLLGERGATVHVLDLDADAAEAVAGRVRAAGGRAQAHRVDVTDAAALDALAERLAPDGVDLLFNNAGIGHAGPVAETPLADWRALLEVNLLGVVHGLHAFLPRMLAAGRPAHVVNTASLAGLVPSPGLVPYSTTKWAVVGLSRGLDRELAGTGVRVHALCPGLIDTAIVRTATMRGEFGRRQPELVRRFGDRGTSPDVVARAALAAVGRRQVGGREVGGREVGGREVGGREVVPTPRYQVLPPWLVDRIAPRVSAHVSALLVRAARGAG